MWINFQHPQAIVLWTGVILLLCAFAPEALAGALRATGTPVCGAAVTLGLAWMQGKNGDPK